MLLSINNASRLTGQCLEYPLILKLLSHKTVSPETSPNLTGVLNAPVSNLPIGKLISFPESLPTDYLRLGDT